MSFSSKHLFYLFSVFRSCLSSPVPVPGKTKLELELLPRELMPVIEFALPDHTRFTLMDFPLHLPIEMLDVDTVIKLLTAIMLEYKVCLNWSTFKIFVFRSFCNRRITT